MLNLKKTPVITVFLILCLSVSIPGAIFQIASNYSTVNYRMSTGGNN